MVSSLPPGTRADVEIWRKGKSKKLSFSLGELQVAGVGATAGEQDKTELGLALRPLTPEERKQAGVEAGLLVQDSEGPAARSGIRAGDVILSVNGDDVDSVTKLRSLITKNGKRVALLILREEQQLFVPLNLG